MESIEFLTLTRSMGFTFQSAADYMGVNRRTVQRWCTVDAPPAKAVESMGWLWDEFDRRIAGFLADVDADGVVHLVGYRDPRECLRATGMPREQWTALVGHVCMAAKAEGFSWSIKLV